MRWLPAVLLWLVAMLGAARAETADGAHAILEVDLQRYWRDTVDGIAVALADRLRAEHVAASDVTRTDDGVSVRVADARISSARDVLRAFAASRNARCALTEPQPGMFALSLEPGWRRETEERLANETFAIVSRRSRIAFGPQATVRRDGARILVAVEGRVDLDAFRALFAPPPTLGLYLVDDAVPDEDLRTGRASKGETILPLADGGGNVAVGEMLLSGDRIKSSRTALDENTGEPIVMVDFDETGGIELAAITGANIDRRLAIVLGGKVLSAPVVREQLQDGRMAISGAFTQQQALDLAVLLSPGGSPAPLRLVAVGPGAAD